MRSTFKYTIIALTCIGLAGCFGSSKKRSRVAAGPTLSASGVNWISGFASYKAGDTPIGQPMPASLRYTDFSQTEYNQYTHCLEGHFAAYGGSNLNRINKVIYTDSQTKPIADFQSCCTSIGRLVGKADRSVQKQPAFTIARAFEIIGKMALRQDMPTPYKPSPNAFGADIQFPSSDWVTKVRAFYASTDPVMYANSSNPSDPAKPFALGASGDATLPSGQFFADVGGVLGPDESTLIAFINAAQTRSVRDVLNWYYATFPVVPPGWWAEYFYGEAFSAMMEEKLLCKTSALRTQWIASQQNPTEFKAHLTAAENEYFCNAWQDSAIHFVNQILMMNFCQAAPA